MQNQKNKFFGLILLTALLSCMNKDKKKEHSAAIQVETADIPLNGQIERWLESTNTDTLHFAIAKLDSMLLNVDDKNSGYYFYQRGMGFMSLGEPEKSTRDLKSAKRLNYLPEACDKFIEFNESLLKIKKHYN